MNSAENWETAFRGPDDDAARLALENLIGLHQASIKRILKALVRSNNDWEDFFHDAVVSAVEYRQDFDPRQAKFLTWFCLIARRRFFDSLRRTHGKTSKVETHTPQAPSDSDNSLIGKKKRQVFQLDWVIAQGATSDADKFRSSDPTPEMKYRGAELRRLVFVWLDSQDELTRIIFVLRHFRRCTRQEVAAILNLTPDKVRGRDQLKPLALFLRRYGYES